MKSKVVRYFILLGFILVILPLGTYAVRDFIEVYMFTGKHIPDNYLSVIFNLHTYINFFTVVDPPNVMAWTIIFIFSFYYAVNVLGMFHSKDKFEQKDEYGSHGTSRWQKENEIINNYYNDKVGWFLGSKNQTNIIAHGKKQLVYKLGMDAAYHPVDGKLNMQVTVVGPPSSNKTTGFVLPNLFNIPNAYKDSRVKPDIIVTDPKSELFNLTSNYFEREGYDVHVLDFIHLKYGDTLNSLDFTTTEKELIEIGDGYVRAAGGSIGSQGHNGNDSFWDDAESQLLSALMGYVLQVYKNPEDSHLKTFPQVAKLLTSDDVSNPIKAKYFFKKANVTGAAEQLWNNFLMAEDRVRANIMIGLATKLRLFSIEGIQKITSSTTLDIRKLGAKKDKPMILYLLMPASDRTFSPIINVMVTTILKQLYKTSYEYNNKLYAPVYLMLEEMANIGKIPGIQEMLGTMRGLRIYPMMIWQSLAQMRQRYGADAMEDILSQCDTQVFLGINDDFTAQYCSKKLGTTTIQIQGTSKRYDGITGDNNVTESNNYHERALLKPEECSRFDVDKFILWQRSRFPAKLYKVQYKYWETFEEATICKPKNISELNLLPNIDIIENDALSVTGFTTHEHEFHHDNNQREIAATKEMKDIETDIDADSNINNVLKELEGSFTIDDVDNYVIKDDESNKDRDF